MNDPTTVMLIEDHGGYREVMERAINREAHMKITSQFGTAEMALRTLQNESSLKHPEIILLDINLPGMSGLEAMPWIKEYAPGAQIIILSQSDNEADILSAISLGASGYLLKSARAQKIIESIVSVQNGGAALESNVAKFILNTLSNKPLKVESNVRLSDRELEILGLLSEGMLKKEIASELKIGTTTVAYHVKNIYEKLQVKNAPAAIRKAYQTGIFPSDA